MAHTEDEPVDLDGEERVYRLCHDWDGNEEVSTVVIRALAEIYDIPPTEVASLQGTVDPDALNRLFEPVDGDRRSGDSYVTFTLQDCTVTLYGDGDIVIEAPEWASSST